MKPLDFEFMHKKPCIRCGEEKPMPEFHAHKDMADGHLNKCRKCVLADVAKWRARNPGARAKEYMRTSQFKSRKYGKKYPCPTWTDEDRVNARKVASNKYAHKRRMRVAEAKPSWANQLIIDEIFCLAAERSRHVDHIVPLNHKEVCGLHCEDNLRCIPKELNERKSNHYWPDMWDESRAKYILGGHA